jgi:hypothetical protein
LHLKRTTAAAVGLFAVLGCLTLGYWLVMRSPLPLQVLLIAAISTAACRHWLDAAAVALAGTALGISTASFASRLQWSEPSQWIPTMVLIAVLSCAVAGIASALSRRVHWLQRGLVVVGILVVIGMLFTAAVGTAAMRLPDGSTRADVLMSRPPIQSDSSDEVLYQNVLSRLRTGESYYSAFSTVLEDGNQRRDVTNDVTSPFSYRLPTWYWLLSKLPGDGLSVVLAACVLGSIAAASAFALGWKLGDASLGLMGAVAVAAFYARYAHPAALLNVEPWAGALGLLAVTLLVLGVERSEIDKRYLLAAAVAALAGALFRELAVVYLLLGLGCVIVVGRGRHERLWGPWAIGLGLFAIVYLAHAFAATSAGNAVVLSAGGLAVAAAPGQGAAWFHPDGSGLYGALVHYADLAMLRPLVGWAVLALAVVGSLVGPRERASRALLGACVLGGVACLFFLRPPGVVDALGTVPGYWGDLVLPTMLACVPLAFARLARPQA